MKQKRRHVTLEQVALHAGVSRSTASLALRGSTSISETTREKVKTSMRELGYIYDRVAANLRSKDSSTVGLIIMELANPFYSELLVGIHQELSKFDKTVILGTTFDSPAIQGKLLATMMEHRVAGIILSAVPGSPIEPIKQVQDLGIPIVLINRTLEGANCDFVGIDNIKGAKIAVDHLIAAGHRRIAFLGGLSQLSTWQGRKLGYDEAHRLAGLACDPALVIESRATRQGGIEAIKKLLALPSRPTAAFCYNDTIAIAVCMHMQAIGLVPGRDLAIVGFDDIPEATIFSPKLTTVSSHIPLLGQYAARVLQARIEGADIPPQRVIIQPKLIIRESCSDMERKKNGN